MALKPLATLSSSGILTSLPEIADRLMSYYFNNNASQSNLYRGNIASLPDLIMRWKDDESRMANEIQQSMQTFLKNHFENAVVYVTTEDIVEGLQGAYNIRVDATIYDDNQQYSLGRILEIYQGQFKKIREIQITGHT